MNLLDRYKARILNTFKISLEDWWDDLRIKYLGDDYRDRGQPDVWEEPELPEQIGVKSPVWTELLTRSDDSMFRYRNLNNNSGVAAYDTGVDWFLIKFNDSSLYLYTTKSTTIEHINYMRTLAREGKGLNSYVNRIVGNQYAGRNYKGNLTLMPGMESISNPKALRALQLIIAHQNTLKGNDMQETISQEGIGDMFTKLKNYVQGRDEHGVKGEDDKPGAKVKSTDRWWSDEYHAEIAQIRDAIKRFYLNPNWLDKQTITTGTVDPKGIAEPLNFNGTLGKDPLSNVDKGIQYIVSKEKQWIPIVMEYDKKIQEIDKRVKQATIGSGVIDDKGEALVEQAIKDMHKLPKPQFKPDGTCGLGNIGLAIKDGEITGRVLKPFEVPKSLPALTKEQIVLAAKLILKVLDFDNVHGRMKTPSWLDHSDGHKFNSWLNDNYESTYFEYYEMDHHSLDDTYINGLYDLFDEPNTLTALEKWIDRSIKGKSDKSSNEEYLMSITLERFEEMEQKSGKDGLEPNAKKALVIAKQLLVKPTVSNEGIWGAVKYLFGGNYENLPKINAAYDEAVDAVKSTYGNPEWVKKRRLNTGKPIKVSPYGEVAADPQKAFEKIKQANGKAVNEATQYVKEEVEYLAKFTKVLTTGDETKIKALLDMFEERKQVQLDSAPSVDFEKNAPAEGMDAQQILKAAEIFIEAVKYRRATDALYSQGMYKLLYTDSGKERYGRHGEVTAKLNGAAKELAIKIGLNGLAVEESFFNSFTTAWDNVDYVVRGTLKAMEASAD